MNNKYKFFFKSKLGNWNITDFRVDGIRFNCGEQYMMYCKAMLFNDTETAFEIMYESEPMNHKDLGRKVKNFNPVVWDENKYDLVKTGLRAKFSQNPELKEYLLKFKGQIFVEASPFDRVWGIGYDADHALENINNWGENLLGKILTELSNEL